MRFHEYGNEDAPAVLLVHGMACTCERSFSPLIEALAQTRHVIGVDLDGHADDGTTFDSISSQAAQIARHLRSHGVTRLDACLGMSMGGFICMDLVCREGMPAGRFVYDSGYVRPLPFPRPFSHLVAWGFGKVAVGSGNPVAQRGMRWLMGYAFKPDQVCCTASYQSIYACEYSCMTYRLPDNLEVLDAPTTTFFYGQKEWAIRQGMQIVARRLPRMRQVCTGRFGHGELMFDHPAQYVPLMAQALLGPAPE